MVRICDEILGSVKGVTMITDYKELPDKTKQPNHIEIYSHRLDKAWNQCITKPAQQVGKHIVLSFQVSKYQRLYHPSIMYTTTTTLKDPKL